MLHFHLKFTGYQIETGFIFFIEILACVLGNKQNNQGIQIEGIDKLNLYADEVDVTLWNLLASFEQLMNILTQICNSWPIK